LGDAEKILSQHEVDALLSAIDGGGGVEAAPEVSAVPYDFRRPERLGREQIKALGSLHEGFGRSLQSMLSALLRTGVEVKLAGVSQVTLREFVQALPRPTVFTAVSAEPLEGTLFLELNASIACPVIERLLGSGKAGAWQQDRPLSPLEWNVIDTVLQRILDLLREAWAPLGAPMFKVIRREGDPASLPLPNSSEAAVSVVLELAVGDQRGCLDLGIPLAAIEGRLEKLSAAAPLGAQRRKDGAGQEGALSRGLAPAEVRLEAALPPEDLRLRELRALRPGDLLVTGHPQSSPLLVSVEGRPKFHARPGRLKDRKAIRISGPAAGDREPSAGARILSGGGPGPEAAPAPAGLVEQLLHLPLTATVVLAEKAMRVRDVLAIQAGDVIAFARRAEEPLELRAADRALAQGSAVRVGDRFGLRVSAVRDARDRVAALGP
jgi:flagellar motor switch protein FliM